MIIFLQWWSGEKGNLYLFSKKNWGVSSTLSSLVKRLAVKQSEQINLGCISTLKSPTV